MCFSASIFLWPYESDLYINYSGTSLLRSPMGLGKNEFNVMENHLGFSKSDRNGEVALLVR